MPGLSYIRSNIERTLYKEDFQVNLENSWASLFRERTWHRPEPISIPLTWSRVPEEPFYFNTNEFSENLSTEEYLIRIYKREIYKAKRKNRNKKENKI